MGERTRTYDWSTSPIGPIEVWPLSLRTTLSIVLHSAFPMFLYWGTDLICFYNDAFRQSLGTNGKHPAVGKQAQEVWAEIWDFIGPPLARVMQTGESVYFENQHLPIYRNGYLDDAYWTFSYTPAYGDAGRIDGVFVTCSETTATVNNHRELTIRQQQVLDSFNQSPVGIAIIDDDQLTFQMANDFYGYLVGRKPEQIIGKPLLEILPELIGQGFDQLIREVITTGIPYVAQEVAINILRNKQLETIHVDLTYQPQTGTDGRRTGVMVVATDVTQQVRARQKIESSELRFRSLIEESPVATCLFVGRELIIEEANAPMLTLLGKGNSVLGKPLAVALPELEGQGFLQILDNVYTTGQIYQDTNASCDLVVDGKLGTYYFDFTYKPLRNPDGQIYAILETSVEVTEQVMARRKLVDSEARYRELSGQLELQVQDRTRELELLNEKLAINNIELASINEELAATNEELAATNHELIESSNLLVRSNENLQKFAYVASHDLQEPLRKIQQFGDLLRQRFTIELGEGVDYLERMQSAASRMSTLIRDLLTFSRIANNRDNNEIVSLTAVVQLVLSDLELRIQETGATVKLDPLPAIEGDASQLGQLFQNLISNALKFHKPDVPPLIHITGDWISTDNLPLGVKPTRYSVAYYRIKVADNGIGFNEKYLDRIFQVFQRLHNRADFAGTGIGLAICEKVVANHGGAISATSQPGKGATFTIYFPA